MAIKHDRNAVIGSLVREGTDAFGMQDYHEGYQDLEDIPFGVAVATGKPMRRVYEMTIENRGAVVTLNRRQRLVWTPPVGEPRTWYGLDYRHIELRVWHDGSVTVEREE
jgi:hypothetical protein